MMPDRGEKSDLDVVYHRLDQQDAVLLQLHDMIRDHIAENRHIEGQIKELVEMYRGSKFMISAFKFRIPIVAAVAAGVIWMREHLRI